MIEQPPQLSRFIVSSVNWDAIVDLDELDSSMDEDLQIFQAGTFAVEAFKGLRNEPKIVVRKDCEGQKAQIGTTVLIRRYESNNPDEAAVVFSHVLFANAALYSQSIELQKTLESQVKELEAARLKEESHKKELANFDEFKKLLGDKPKRGRPPKKKE